MAELGLTLKSGCCQTLCYLKNTFYLQNDYVLILENLKQSQMIWNLPLRDSLLGEHPPGYFQYTPSSLNY